MQPGDWRTSEVKPPDSVVSSLALATVDPPQREGKSICPLPYLSCCKGFTYPGATPGHFMTDRHHHRRKKKEASGDSQ
jgi:hypothetical protein